MYQQRDYQTAMEYYQAAIDNMSQNFQSSTQSNGAGTARSEHMEFADSKG